MKTRFYITLTTAFMLIFAAVGSVAAQDDTRDVAGRLLPPPETRDCIVSPDGYFNVTIYKQTASHQSQPEGELYPNQWATVILAGYEGMTLAEAQHEPVSLSLVVDILAPDDNPDNPDQILSPDLPIWLYVTIGEYTGWVPADSVRFGGNCQ